jgi:oligoendopeptidase F
LLEIPEATLRAWLERKDLAIYRHAIEDLLRSRSHILSPREEELLAMSCHATEAATEAQSLLANTELRWRTVRDAENRDVEITPSRYYQAMYSKDRRYRREAFIALHDSHADVQCTLAAMLAGAMHRDWYFARARHYGSCLEASLDAENLPVTVYHNLLETVESHLPLLHRYLVLKKRALAVDQVHAYDLHVNLVDRPERTFEFDEARNLVLQGTEPFGPEYGAVLRRAFTERWIDVYENKGKMSGAYNMGTYLAPPYVLLNYKGTFNDVSTLAHELGHAMQSWFAKEHQPPVYAGYPMFTAEVASTAAEIVFKQFMLDRTRDPQERAFLINQMLEDMRGTVFRQTQFARFDLAAHQLVERGEPITAQVLMRIGREIGSRYYGPDFAQDPSLDVEVLRIPHYYRNFYVYRYATSYCAAAAIARRIREGEPGAIDRWLTFLKTGNSRYALDMLHSAGVDMTTPRPIAEAMTLFETLLGQLEELIADPARSIDRPPAP